MRKSLILVLLVVTVVVTSGCETMGLSIREKGSFNYSNFIYGLYDKNAVGKAQKPQVKRPLKLAVAQVGENAPPEAFMDKLRQQPDLFSKVVALPAGGPEGQGYSYYQNNQPANTNGEFEEKMTKMRRLAQDMEADYIFLFGGSADYGTTPNWLHVFDITLIGGYIFPSNKIFAEGRAAGALIDVATGQVVFMVTSEAKKEQSAPTFLAYSEQDRVVVKLRDELVTSLSQEFIEKAQAL